MPALPLVALRALGVITVNGESITSAPQAGGGEIHLRHGRRQRLGIPLVAISRQLDGMEWSKVKGFALSHGPNPVTLGLNSNTLIHSHVKVHEPFPFDLGFAMTAHKAQGQKQQPLALP